MKAKSSLRLEGQPIENQSLLIPFREKRGQYSLKDGRQHSILETIQYTYHEWNQQTCLGFFFPLKGINLQHPHQRLLPYRVNRSLFEILIRQSDSLFYFSQRDSVPHNTK